MQATRRAGLVKNIPSFNPNFLLHLFLISQIYFSLTSFSYLPNLFLSYIFFLSLRFTSLLHLFLISQIYFSLTSFSHLSNLFLSYIFFLSLKFISLLHLFLISQIYFSPTSFFLSIKFIAFLYLFLTSQIPSVFPKPGGANFASPSFFKNLI